MDYSKEYILMCDKAVEIQNEWKPIIGDYIYDREVKDHGYNSKINSIIIRAGIKVTVEKYPEDMLLCSVENKHLFLWLPRQDQLQEIVKPNKYNSYWLVQKMYEFVNDKNAGELTGNPSCEQLWLAFVMHEKYGKTWNGKEWVKTQEGVK